VVEPRLSPQWFVKTEPLAKPAIEAVEQGRTKFVPESWTSTYFQWMRNIHDWCVSRQLWWGHQIPAYYCTACSPRVGDDTDLPIDAPTVRLGGIDFSRADPIVARQQPTACPKCAGSTFTQDPDVLDTWFSSALWPFSTLGWPEKTPELKTFYPTSVMETGHDIIFFWVARMMMMGLHFMGDVPFRTVYLHAMVRDEKGEKMSKTKGNVIDPLDLILGAPGENLPPSLRNKFPQGMPPFGADAVRFTLASLTQQGRDMKLSLDRVAGYKAFANKLWNASRFVLMNLGGFRLDLRPIKERELTLADRWILARLQRAIVDTRLALRRSPSPRPPPRSTSSSGPSSVTGTSSCPRARCTGPARRPRTPPARCSCSAWSGSSGCCTRSCPSSPRRSGRSCRSRARWTRS
jgi:valyl-tRNA synthetase